MIADETVLKPGNKTSTSIAIIIIYCADVWCYIVASGEFVDDCVIAAKINMAIHPTHVNIYMPRLTFHSC